MTPEDCMIAVEITDPAWEAVLPGLEDAVRMAVFAGLRAGLAGAPLGPFGADGGAELSVTMADDKTVHHLNREWRGRDRPTNVLSFALAEAGERFAGQPVMLGDIVLARETVLREAAEKFISPAAHVNHLVIHGLLHLLGYDHQDDESEATMQRLESRAMKDTDFDDPWLEIHPARPDTNGSQLAGRRGGPATDIHRMAEE